MVTSIFLLTWLILHYQAVLLGEGVSQMLIEVLERSFDATDSDGKQIPDSRHSAKFGFSFTSWCLPVFQSISLLCNSGVFLLYPGRYDL